MPRLRTTTALSLLALLAGVLGTQWLCTLTDDGLGPWTPGVAAASRVAPRPTPSARPRRTHAPPRVAGALAAPTAPVPAVAAPSLVPLRTPAASTPYARLRGHLDGRVVLDVATDGSGRVTSAGIARSSGDAVLDAHALATVRGWRFAVPAGRGGVQGQLPMRFESTLR